MQKPWKKRFQKRRRNEIKKKKRLKNIAKNNTYITGPYIDDKDVTRNPGRGDRSPYHKKASNRKLRRVGVETLPQKGEYKKFYDFWNNID